MLYLETLVAQLQIEKERASLNGENAATRCLPTYAGRFPTTTLSPTSSSPWALNAAYKLVAEAAKASAPAVFSSSRPRYALPYYRVFFMSAEPPFPLAFQHQRSINVPSNNGGTGLTQLTGEVVDQLMAVYIERILPQYPLFLKKEVVDMMQRFKMATESSDADELFMISMMMAIAIVSSRAKDHRRLISMAESLRRDALSRINFDKSSGRATATTLRQLLLLAQYGYQLPSVANLWQIVGDATTIALGLGLHQETPRQSGLTEEAIESRKRLFWTACYSQNQHTEPLD